MKQFLYSLASLLALAWSMQAQTLLIDENFAQGIPSNWMNIDADADGNKWISESIASGVSFATSYSYNPTGGALTPDNWLITPLLEGAEKLSYKVANAAALDVPAYYPEHYGVYTSSTGVDPKDFTLLYEETTAEQHAAYHFQNRETTLPEGVKYIAFRHYDVTDKGRLALTDLKVWDKSDVAMQEVDPRSYKIACQKGFLEVELYVLNARELIVYDLQGRLIHR